MQLENDADFCRWIYQIYHKARLSSERFKVSTRFYSLRIKYTYGPLNYTVVSLFLSDYGPCFLVPMRVASRELNLFFSVLG